MTGLTESQFLTTLDQTFSLKLLEKVSPYLISMGVINATDISCLWLI